MKIKQGVKNRRRSEFKSGCKKAKPAKTYHSITLTKCYADYEIKNKDIARYLEQIF